MKYSVQGLAELYLTIDTDLAKQQFETRFHPENIIKSTLEIVASDGSLVRIDVMEYLKLNWLSHLEKENH